MEIVGMFTFSKEKGNTINKYQYYLLIKFYINGYYICYLFVTVNIWWFFFLLNYVKYLSIGFVL